MDVRYHVWIVYELGLQDFFRHKNTQGIFSKRFAYYGFFSGMFFTIIFPPIYINLIKILNLQ